MNEVLYLKVFPSQSPLPQPLSKHLQNVVLSRSVPLCQNFVSSILRGSRTLEGSKLFAHCLNHLCSASVFAEFLLYFIGESLYIRDVLHCVHDGIFARTGALVAVLMKRIHCRVFKEVMTWFAVPGIVRAQHRARSPVLR